MIMYETTTNRRYESSCGHVMQREQETENVPFNNWVLRSPDGSYIDHDQYRDDLAVRHNILLKEIV